MITRQPSRDLWTTFKALSHFVHAMGGVFLYKIIGAITC